MAFELLPTHFLMHEASRGVESLILLVAVVAPNLYGVRGLCAAVGTC